MENAGGFVFCSFVSLGIRTTELISNGGFESLPLGTGWTLSGATASANGGFARSGTRFLWNGGAVSFSDSGYQTITIPSSATVATLSFYYNINSQEGVSVANDTFTATIRNTSGTVLATVVNLSNKDQTSPGSCCYTLKTFNLLPYTGQTVRIHFASVNNASLVTNFRVDDVSVLVTTGPTLSSIQISSGPTQVNENSSAQYTCTATYSDATTANVTSSASWSINTSYASISGGNLTTSEVPSDQSCQISVSYGGRTALANITIKDVPVIAPSPDLRSVSGIPSSTEVGQSFTVTISAENDAGVGGQYSAINTSILYSDGTDDVTITDATAAWGDNQSPYNFAPGTLIRDNACNQISAIDHLVEAQDNTG